MTGTDGCTHVEELLALSSLGALEARDIDVDVAAHTSRCVTCRSAAAGFATVAGMLPDALPLTLPSAQLRRSIMAEVHADAARTARNSERASARSMLRRLWNSVPAGRGFTLAAAAAVLLAVWGMARDTPGAPAPALTASYTVSGTTAEPDASGKVLYDAATRQAVVLVIGLPAPDISGNAHAYEVWLIPSAGTPVPAGFLTLQPDGRTWAAVLRGNVRAYRALAATIEPAGGSPAPTGTEVVSSTLG
jgi:anti-sigma-K factor RskA